MGTSAWIQLSQLFRHKQAWMVLSPNNHIVCR